jgi:hypothetical protein
VLDAPALPALNQAVTGKKAELPNDASYWAARLMALTSQCNLLVNNPADAPVMIGFLIEAAKGAGHQTAALQALGSLGGDAAITFLIEASKSQDTSTAESATQALIYAYNKACGTSVLITGLKHPNPNVREQAFLFLGMRAGTMTNKKPVAEALERSLKDPSYAVREMCARALGIFGDQTVAPALVEVFRSNPNLRDRNEHSRAFALFSQALYQISPECLNLLAGERDPEVVKSEKWRLRDENSGATMKKFYRGFALGGGIVGLIVGFNLGGLGGAIIGAAVCAIFGYVLGAIVGAFVTSW